MNSIRGFEAVVRLGSFTAAAHELGVTQGAISRQIKMVEEFLDKRLFRPAGRGLIPTEWAEEYAMELRVALDRIEAATERIAEPTTRHVLRVNVIHTLAMRWLIPRLPSFQRRHPKLDVRITTSSGPVSQIEEPFDIAIRRAAMTYPGFESKAFLRDVSLPVCTPAVLAECPINGPGDIARHTLIYPGVPGGTWEMWFARTGTVLTSKPKQLRFANFYVALHAASEGLGTIMAPRALVADVLKSGQMVAPFKYVTIPCSPVHVLFPKEGPSNLRSQAFVGWLFEQGIAAPQDEVQRADSS